MDLVAWLPLIVVLMLQALLFFKGVRFIRYFINVTAPCVYFIVITLFIFLYQKSTNQFTVFASHLFLRPISSGREAVVELLEVTGTMLLLYALIILSHGNFARFCTSEKVMRRGNLQGLSINMMGFA